MAERTRVRAPNVLKAPTRPGVLGYPDRVFSVSCAGRSRPPAPDRVFSVSNAGCSRFPAPGVLCLLFQTGYPRFPVSGILGYPDRVFSVSCAGCSRLPWPDVLSLLRRAFSASCSRPGDFGARRTCYSRDVYPQAYNESN